MNDKDPCPLAQRRHPALPGDHDPGGDPDARTKPRAQAFDHQIEIGRLMLMRGEQLLEERHRTACAAIRDIELRQLLELDEPLPVGTMMGHD